RHVAARHPDRVTGLVMGNTEIPGHFPWQLTVYLAAARLPGGAKMFTTMLKSRLFRQSPLIFGACFADVAFADGEFHELCTRPILEDARHREGTLALLDTFDITVLKELPRVHRRIEAPVQLVWGKDDPFFPLPKAKKMMSQFRRAELTVLDPGKLFVHEERPDAFAEAAIPFLERAFADGATPAH
ncbi:MAG: alpha/beta hydrolase, partial [Polyangiaceae bacterium]